MSKPRFLYIRRSIGNQYITTFLLCLVLPIILLAAVFTGQLRQLLYQKEYQSMHEKVQIGGGAFDTVVQDMKDIVASVIVNDDVMNTLRSSHAMPTYEWFQEFKALENLLLSVSTKSQRSFQVSILSMDGKRYRSGALYDSMLGLDSAVVLRLLQEPDGQFLINRQLEGIDDSLMLTFGKRIVQGGQTLGIMLVDIPIAKIDELFSIFDRSQYSVFILNDQDRLLYSFQEQQSAVLFPELHQQLFSQQQRTIVEGRPHLSILRTSVAHQTAVAVLVPEAVIYSESSRLVALLAIALAAVILCTIVTLFLLSARISRNLQILTRSVADYGRTGQVGTLAVQSSDEVGQLASGFLSMQKQIDQLMAQIRSDEQTKWQLRFQALQAQINPHMIYNTLNTITYLAQLQNVENIADVSASFARLLRMVSKRKDEWISVSEELECIAAYLLIKKYNLIWDVQVVYDVDQEALHCRILKLLVQPLIENAIVHGFSQEQMEGQITVIFRRLGNRLYLEVWDNGVGMSQQRLQEVLQGEQRSGSNFSNIGVCNTIDRLRIQYGDQASFEMESAPGQGTVVKISYPAEPFEEGIEE